MIRNVLFALGLFSVAVGFTQPADSRDIAPQTPAKQTAALQPVDFTRDIRPILSDTCFLCHGPDEKNRKGGLRLDTKKGAFADLGGHKAIVPGEPDKSALFLRINHKDDAKRMPPVKARKQLKPAQIELIRRWIEEGAPWEEHWAFVPPKLSPLPKVHNPA